MTQFKAPNTKHQTPKKLQIPNTKHQALNSREAPSSKLEARAAVWSLDLGISLVFGASFLVFRFRDSSGVWCLGSGVSFRMLAASLRGVGFVLLGLVAAFRASGLGVLVPAYFYPAPGSAWDALNLAAQRVPLTAIMNPSNGPSMSPNADYIRSVTALHNAGGLVIGYVYSTYTMRAIAEVKT